MQPLRLVPLNPSDGVQGSAGWWPGSGLPSVWEGRPSRHSWTPRATWAGSGLPASFARRETEGTLHLGPGWDQVRASQALSPVLGDCPPGKCPESAKRCPWPLTPAAVINPAPHCSLTLPQAVDLMKGLGSHVEAQSRSLSSLPPARYLARDQVSEATVLGRGSAVALSGKATHNVCHERPQVAATCTRDLASRIKLLLLLSPQ